MTEPAQAVHSGERPNLHTAAEEKVAPPSQEAVSGANFKGPKTVDAEFAALRVDIDDDEDVQLCPHVEANRPPSIGVSPSNSSKGVTPKGSDKFYVPTGTNVFIAGIPTGWDEKKLIELCQPFGEIASVKLVLNRHYAFVMYKEPKAAEIAIKALHCTRTGPTGGLLHVAVAMHDEGAEEAEGDRLFIRGLPPWMNRDELRAIFSPYGTLTECTILYTSDGQCKGVAFVQYPAIEQARAAKDALSGKKLDQWNFPLEIRYSETTEVRAVRQQRNRDRMMRSTPPARQIPTPTSIHPQQGLPLAPPPPPPPPFVGGIETHVIPAPQAFPIPAHVNLPSPANHIPSPLAAAGAPRHVLPLPAPNTPPTGGAPVLVSLPPPSPSHPQAHPQVLGQPPMLPSPHSQLAPGPLLVPAPAPAPPHMVNIPPPAAFPATGDVLMHGAPLTPDLITQLLARFGLVEQLASVPTGGFIVRMKDRNQHQSIVQTLQGVLFSTGHVLQVALIQV